MMGFGFTKECTLCGEEKNCTPVVFVPVTGKDQVKVKAYTGIQYIPMAGEFTLNACEDCGREKGSNPTKAWIAVLVGYVLLFGGIACMTMEANSYNPGPSFFMGMTATMAGWLTSMIAGCVLVFKMRHEKGSQGLSGLSVLQVFPILGLIALAANAKQINRCNRAVTALTAVAGDLYRTKKDKEESLTRLVESGAALTEEQQQQVEEMEQEKEDAEIQAEYARAQQEEQVNKANMRGAVIGIVITLILGAIGAYVYGSGYGYMTLFGQELSPSTFAIVIGVLIVWDVISLTSALKKRK